MKIPTTFLVTTVLIAVTSACSVYKPDEHHFIYMDVEQRGPGGGWEHTTTPAGWLGSGALTYKPWSSFGGTEWKPSSFKDPRIKSYFFQVNVPGTYRVLLRSAAPHWTEHNDCWMALPESGSSMTKDGFNIIDIAGVTPAAQLNGDWADNRAWFKVYQNEGLNKWNVGGKTKDFDGHSIIARKLDAGKWYSVRIAGRSTQFAIDRIIVFRCENHECGYNAHRYEAAKNYYGPQSECLVE